MLDKIIERSTSQPPPLQRPEAFHDHPQHHDRSDYPYRQKKRKFLLGELFDF
jgi:Zn-finger nucleic acid-binding protein